MEDRVITTKEASEIIGISARMVRKHAENGKLPSAQHGRDLAFKLTDVQTFKAKRPKRGRPAKSVQAS